ncbi:MAG: glucoamylase [Candidatus Lokiarchaeota archaeon]|nr:glucoamylase [Candidatus Lokiarchaeota archaeon]
MVGYNKIIFKGIENMIDIDKAESLYDESIKILKKVQLDNGGCLATSEDERYPYIYPRDHSLIILGFISAGLFNEARKGLEFILNTHTGKGAFPQRVDTKGNDASYKPIQIDGTGLVLYSLARYVTETEDYDFAEQYFNRVKRAVNYIIDHSYENIEGTYEKQKHNLEMPLIYTPNSLHEYPPTEAGLEIWANCVCCSALLEIFDISKKIDEVQLQCEQYAKKVKKGILKYMWNSRKKTFVKTIRVRESSSVLVDPDVGKYAVADFGILNDEDERVISTVTDIEKNLWNQQLGGICRYPKYEGRNNGGWGPWPNYTLMICRHHIRVENKQKTDQYLNWVLNRSFELKLPEHVSSVSEFEEYVQDFKESGLLREDRKKMIQNARNHPLYHEGIAYITIPLAWAHAEFIRTYNLYKEQFKG